MEKQNIQSFINRVICGECISVMKDIPDKSVDCVITDPPYELGFMGKSWDNTGIANNPEMWKECLRVLKPGGYLLSFGGTRTYHRMASAIEDAGFEVRDMIEWVYGSGFPKSLNIGKAVDKLQGNEREVIGIDKNAERFKEYKEQDGCERKTFNDKITKGTSEYEGWGTALKPAHEPICMARKPLAEKTVAQNCLKYGTGGINIDESRVEFASPEDLKSQERAFSPNSTSHTGGNNLNNGNTNFKCSSLGEANPTNILGRFPANLIHDNSEEVRECFPENNVKGSAIRKNKVNPYGGERTWSVSDTPAQDTVGYADSGNASRFFKSIIYQAKASKSERNKGMDIEKEINKRPIGEAFGNGNAITDFTETKGNNHPTVKPIALMEYLIKMVTPKGGVVLDPFAGSGSTLVAAKQNGFQYIGIEMTEEYIPIIEARLSSQIK